MHDWDRIVEQRLPKLKLPEAREAEIREELAEHFAEMHVDLLAKTGSAEEAMRQALEEIGDWHSLARKIRISEMLGKLSLRVRTFWLPGLMGFAAAMLSGIALSMMWRSMPDGGRALRSAINDSGLGLAFLGLLQLPAGFVASGVAWYLGASGVRRACVALFPLLVIEMAFTLTRLLGGASLHAVLTPEPGIILYVGTGLIAGGLPFFFRRQRLSVFTCRWLAQ